MNYRRAFVISLTLSCLLVAPWFALAEEQQICRFHDHRSFFGIDLEGDGRKYAPDRQVDIKHIKLDVTPDFAKRTVSGTTTLKFAPISKPLSELKLDAVNLTVDDVRSDVEIAEVTNTGENLLIRFKQAIPVDEDRFVEGVDEGGEADDGQLRA